MPKPRRGGIPGRTANACALSPLNQKPCAAKIVNQEMEGPRIEHGFLKAISSPCFIGVSSVAESSFQSQPGPDVIRGSTLLGFTFFSAQKESDG